MAIGVFDSGVGGLSVHRALVRRFPEADLIYLAGVEVAAKTPPPQDMTQHGRRPQRHRTPLSPDLAHQSRLRERMSQRP